MSNQKLILIILLIAFSLTACKKSQEGGSLSEEDIVKLKNISLIWAQAIMDRDWDKAASIYAEDGIRLGEYPPIRGRDAIREWLAAPTSVTIESFSVSNTRVEGYGDLAYIWDSASLSISIPGEGKTSSIEINENWLAIARKQPDGSWLVVLDMWNSDVPFPDDQ